MARQKAPTEMEIHERREAFYKDLRRTMSKRFAGYDPHASEVCFNIAQTFGLMEGLLSDRAKVSGLTLAGVNVLTILHQHKPTGCPLNTLSDLLVVSRANVTGLVDSLVRNGLVTRHDHATDRRVVLAKITAKGEALFNAHLSKHYGCMREMTTAITRQEKETLIQILTQVRKRLLRQRDQ